MPRCRYQCGAERVGQLVHYFVVGCVATARNSLIVVWIYCAHVVYVVSRQVRAVLQGYVHGEEQVAGIEYDHLAHLYAIAIHAKPCTLLPGCTGGKRNVVAGERAGKQAGGRAHGVDIPGVALGAIHLEAPPFLRIGGHEVIAVVSGAADSPAIAGWVCYEAKAGWPCGATAGTGILHGRVCRATRMESRGRIDAGTKCPIDIDAYFYVLTLEKYVAANELCTCRASEHTCQEQ